MKSKSPFLSLQETTNHSTATVSASTWTEKSPHTRLTMNTFQQDTQLAFLGRNTFFQALSNYFQSEKEKRTYLDALHGSP